MSNPEVCVLKTAGINCDAEMAHAFEVAGAESELVYVNQLQSGERRLDQYSILAIPGGFSYGDDIASGKVFATEIMSYFSDQLQDFVDKGKPIIGICNGFQVLVRAGLLSSRAFGEQKVTLSKNEVGRFECRWIDLTIEPSACRFINPEDFTEQPVPMQIAHGEGRLSGDDNDVRHLIDNDQVVFRYTTFDLKEPNGYPDNPNGATYNIAGICDPSGLILGMMPHPERSIATFHPHRIRTEAARSAAHVIFNNIVGYAKEM